MWIHLLATVCHPLFSGLCDLDLLLQFWIGIARVIYVYYVRQESKIWCVDTFGVAQRFTLLLGHTDPGIGLRKSRKTQVPRNVSDRLCLVV